MEKDDRDQAAEEQPEGPGYQAPKAEEVPSIEGPAVTSAGATVNGDSSIG